MLALPGRLASLFELLCLVIVVRCPMLLWVCFTPEIRHASDQHRADELLSALGQSKASENGDLLLLFIAFSKQCLVRNIQGKF